MTNEEMEKLIGHLQGTCISLNEGTQALFDLDEDCLTTENSQQIDDEIFLCEECGWWYEVSEMSEREDEQVCNDCHEE